MHDRTEEREEALSRHLARVAAPGELWERIRAGGGGASGGGQPAVPKRRARLTYAALVLAMGGAGWLVWPGTPVGRPMTIESASVREVHDWVLANSGLDVPLPAKPSSLVELLGASIDRTGKVIALISYQVGEMRATLLVSRDETGSRSHREGSTSWTMGGQSYTLAVAGPGELKTACLLCHSSAGAALY